VLTSCMIEEADTGQCHDKPRRPAGDAVNAATALLGASRSPPPDFRRRLNSTGQNLHPSHLLVAMKLESLLPDTSCMIEEADTGQCHDKPRRPAGDAVNAATALLGGYPVSDPLLSNPPEVLPLLCESRALYLSLINLL
jgi:hypothetical protein